MAGSSAYPVVVHQTVPSKDAASVNSMATRSSAAQSSHSSITSEDSYISSESSSMWSSQEAAGEQIPARASYTMRLV